MASRTFMPNRNPVIVLGMHRSGTSAMARLVQELGLSLGTNLLGATEGNIYGHFEDAAFIRFHDALIARFYPQTRAVLRMAAAGRRRDRVIYRRGSRRGEDDLECPSGLRQLRMERSPHVALSRSLGGRRFRMRNFIVCLRHPYQVHHSLLRRGEPFLHVDYSAAITGWTVYNRRILQALPTLSRDQYVVLDVEAAFREPEATRGGACALSRPAFFCQGV